MRILILLLLLSTPLLAQSLTPETAAKLELFQLKADLHTVKVELVKANAEKLLLQAQLEGLQLQMEQKQLEEEALKALGADPLTHTFDWATRSARPIEKK